MTNTERAEQYAIELLASDLVNGLSLNQIVELAYMDGQIDGLRREIAELKGEAA